MEVKDDTESAQKIRDLAADLPQATATLSTPYLVLYMKEERDLFLR